MLAPIPGRILRHSVQFKICKGVDVYQSPQYKLVAVHRVAVQPTADIAKSRDNTDLSFKSICFIDARRSSAADPVKWLEMSEKNGSSLKMVFGDTTYTVSGVDTLYDDTGMLHHWEVLLT